MDSRTEARKMLKGKTLGEIAVELPNYKGAVLREAVNRVITPANKRAKRIGDVNRYSIKNVKKDIELIRIANESIQYMRTDSEIKARKKEAQKAYKEHENAKKKSRQLAEKNLKRIASEKKKAELKAESERKQEERRKAKEAKETERKQRRFEYYEKRKISKAREKEKKEIEEILSKNPHKLTLSEMKEALEKIVKFRNKQIDENEYDIPDNLRTKKFEVSDNPGKWRSEWMRALAYQGKPQTENLEKAFETITSKGHMANTEKNLENLSILENAFNIYEKIRKEYPYIFSEGEYMYEIIDIVQEELRTKSMRELEMNLEEVYQEADRRIRELRKENEDIMTNFFGREEKSGNVRYINPAIKGRTLHGKKLSVRPRR